MHEWIEGDRRKLVYVMGAGHSGSTILGIALGNCDGFFYAGELEEWLMTSSPRWGASERQSFWSAVSERVERVDQLSGGRANRYLERSSASLRFDRWHARRRLRPAYRRVAEELIRAVSDVAQARYVIDTSHFPLRARELRELPGIDLYLIYLVRDPVAVVASATRELSEHEVVERRSRKLLTNANLWITQMLSVRTFLSHPPDRRILVRHEDFLDDPAAILREILRALGSDARTPNLEELEVGAPLQGNQLIRADSVAVRRTGGAAPPRDSATRLAQAVWRPVLDRLAPAAGSANGSAASGGNSR
jgi:hypothetical protein